MSSFFLISAALFMGGGFCALRKKEKQAPQAKGEAATKEVAPERALTGEGTDSSEKQLWTETMYVTSV